MRSSEVSHDRRQAACLTHVTVPGSQMAVTFVFIQVVFELPLGHQDVEVTRLLKEAQVPHGDVGGEHPLELPAPGILILCLHQDANIIWGQDVQDRRIKILQTRATQGQGEVNYILLVPLPTFPLLKVSQARGLHVSQIFGAQATWKMKKSRLSGDINTAQS